VFLTPDMLANLPTAQLGMQANLSSLAGAGAAPPTAFQQSQLADAQQGAQAPMSMGQAPTAAAPMIPASAQMPQYATSMPQSAPDGEGDWQHPHAEAVEREGPGYMRHLHAIGHRHGGEAAAANHALHLYHMLRAGHVKAAKHLDLRVLESIVHHGSRVDALNWNAHVTHALAALAGAQR
jgi:hypothetical protein